MKWWTFCFGVSTVKWVLITICTKLQPLVSIIIKMEPFSDFYDKFYFLSKLCIQTLSIVYTFGRDFNTRVWRAEKKKRNYFNGIFSLL